MTSQTCNAPTQILTVDLSIRFGGSNTRVLNLASAFPKDRMTIAALAGSPLHRAAEKKRLRVVPIPGPKWNPGIINALCRIIRSGKIDLVDAHNPQSKLWAGIAAKRCNIPLVSTLNSWYRAEYGNTLKGRVYQLLEQWTREMTTVFVAVSSDIRRHLINSGVPGTKICMIPNSPGKPNSGGDRTQICRQFNFPGDTRLCTAVGRLVWAKGFDVLIEAMAAIKDKRICCLIVGEGGLRDALSHLIQKHNLENRVVLAGLQPCETVYEIIGASNLFVMPSRSEGTPIALMEAAFLKTPVVASRIGGIPEVIRHEKEGILVPSDDALALARAMETLLNTPEQGRVLSGCAFQRMVLRHSIDIQVKTTLTAYEKALARHKRRRP